MATVKKSPEEIAAEGGGQQTLGTGGSSGSSDLGGGTGSGSVKTPQGGTGFTNVSDYLDANKGNKTATNVGNYYQGEANKVKEGTESAANSAISGIGARTEDTRFKDYLNSDLAKQRTSYQAENQKAADEWVNNNNIDDPWVQQQYNLQSQKAGNAQQMATNNQNLLRQLKSQRKNDYLSNLNNQAEQKAQTQYQKDLSGLTTRYNYTNATPNEDISGATNQLYSNFNTDLGRLGNSEGIQSLLSEQNGGKAGLSALDSALLQRSGGAAPIQQQYSNIGNYLTTAQQQIAAADAARKAEQNRGLTDTERDIQRRMDLANFANNH